MHHPDALPQGDARPWPARHGCPVGRLCHLEVVHASDMLNDAAACVVPNIDAEGEVGLGQKSGGTGGQTRSRGGLGFFLAPWVTNLRF